ncbi:MAG: hypothetical protein JRN16_02680 [Nitrososphaerota archaeon]|nr:hypothetical protein [Nitrososphaerota archaeon]
MDETELSKQIAAYLNRVTLGMHFEFIDSFCDVADEKNKIYIEVKPEHFALAQILHATAIKGIKDAKYLGVADGKEVRLYAPPIFSKVLSFAKSFDPTLVFSASQADKPELNSQAEKILGNPEKVISLKFSSSPYLFISKDSMETIREATDRYRIHLDLLVNWLDGVGEKDSIKVNSEGWLVNIDRRDVFTNEYTLEQEAKEITEFSGGHRRPRHNPIRQNEKGWFESLRIRHEDLPIVLHEVDRLLSRKKRRESGVFWTEAEIGDLMADEVLRLTRPGYVVEPCVGGGSLVKKIVPRVKGTMNDISIGHVENCKRIYDGYSWKFTTLDVVRNDTGTLIEKWGIPAKGTLLLYTNPPFGTSSTGQIVSKKGELDGKASRQQVIFYPPALQKYGKGDLFIPIIGRLIEVAKTQKKCYLAFFSPFGLFCKRKRYLKLFTALAKDFIFLRGHVFAGHNFHDINRTLTVALSVWEYSPNANTQNRDLTFEFLSKSGERRVLRFKEMPLLKEGWRYRDGSKYVKTRTTDAIGAPRCDRFNAPEPKIIGVDLKEGSGAELSPDNLKIDKVVLSIPNIPPELAYGLWSVSVGLGAFRTSLSNPLFPIYFRDAYVHLPDFSKKKTLEILAYAALEVLLKNYAEDRIGFFGTNKVFRFGNERLTKGVEYLLNLCKDAPTYDGNTIGDTLELFKQEKVNPTKLRRSLKEEVSKRLDAIGYWEFVPLPLPSLDKEGGAEEEPVETHESKTSSALAAFDKRRKRNRKKRVIQDKLG